MDIVKSHQRHAHRGEDDPQIRGVGDPEHRPDTQHQIPQGAAASTSMPNGSIRERQAKMTPDRANTITPAKSNQ